MFKAGVGITLALAAGIAAAEGAVSAEWLLKQMQQPAATPFVLDVRTAEEFVAGHVPGAVNIPIQSLEARLSELPEKRELVVYCEKGGRAKRAISLLSERGYPAHELEGSMSAWRATGHPVAR